MTASDSETMDETTETGASTTEQRDVVDRVLSRQSGRSVDYTLFGDAAPALQDAAASVATADTDGDQFDRDDRQALRRVAGLSTELDDVTEVEYRQLRIENVVLIGIYSQGN